MNALSRATASVIMLGFFTALVMKTGMSAMVMATLSTFVIVWAAAVLIAWWFEWKDEKR